MDVRKAWSSVEECNSIWKARSRSEILNWLGVEWEGGRTSGEFSSDWRRSGEKRTGVSLESFGSVMFGLTGRPRIALREYYAASVSFAGSVGFEGFEAVVPMMDV